MNQVVDAIAQGRCSLAVSGSLLRDSEVMLALVNRAALKPMALSGPAVLPVVPVSDAGAARACASKNGVIVLVEPESADQKGLENLGQLLTRGPHKPKVVIVSRNYNPFALGTALRGLKVEHSKGRGKEFIKGLPTPPAEADLPEIAKAKGGKKPKDSGGPRFSFVGRETEVEALGALLGDGGPIVVSGAPGTGRTQVVEHALAASELTRLPDLTLGWDVGFDTLIARIAETCAQAGQASLATLLRSKGRNPAALVAGAVEALKAADDLAGQAMVISELEFALGEQTDFFKRSRIELLLEALLTNSYPLRLIFVSARQPIFHREGQAAPLRRLEIEGIKGKFLHEIFEAYKAPEFPRDRFGAISDKIHGNPLAARLFATSLKNHAEPETLLGDDKYFRMKRPGDTAAIGKRSEKALGRLPKDQRACLALLAHTRVAVTGQVLSGLGISRKIRMGLLASGLLDVVGTNEAKRYRVHSVVRRSLTYRESHDFESYEELVGAFKELGKKAEGVQALAWFQEANRCAIAARKPEMRTKVDFPDQDSWLENSLGLIRGKMPRLDIALTRLKEAVRIDPSNSDAYLLAAQALRRDEAGGEDIMKVFGDAIEHGPVPELFHRLTSYWMHRGKRPKAIEVLEQAVVAHPAEPQLRTRLASLLIQQGRRPEGLTHLQTAMDLAPMLPDAYGLMGQARRAEGKLEEAESLLREAARLGAGDPVQISRLADLLLARARIDLPAQDTLRTEAAELLDHVISGDRPAQDAYLLKSTLVRETSGDLEQAAWLLKRARKDTERRTDRHRRIQIEAALQSMANGHLDDAAHKLRERCGLDPSDHRTFAALGHVLEAQEMFVPAHAEYLRAMERAPKDSLAAQLYQLHLKRMQAVIEAQAAGLLHQPEPEAATAPLPDSRGHLGRVIRRKKKSDGSDEADDGVQAKNELDADTEQDAMPADIDAATEIPSPAEPPGEAVMLDDTDSGPAPDDDAVADDAAPEAAAEASEE